MEIFDLTITLNEDTKVQSEDTGYSDPLTRFKPWVEFQHKGYRVTEIVMGAHAGTHCDVPYHFLEDGKTTTDYSLDQWIGWAVVLDFRGKGPISVEMILPYKDRIVGKDNIIVVMKHGYTDYFTDSARSEFLSWQPKAVVMGEGINIDERYAESNEFLKASVPMIMNVDHQQVAGVRDGDLIIAGLLKVAGLEAAPARLIAIRGLEAAVSKSQAVAELSSADKSKYEEQIGNMERLIGRLTIQLEELKSSVKH